MTSLSSFDIAPGDWSAADHKMDAAELSIFRIITRAPSMAAIIETQPSFIDLLSTTCQTIRELDRFISLSAFYAASNPEDPSHHNPSEYHILQIDVVKRHVFVQHEGIILTVRRAHPLAPADDFYLLINRDVKSTSLIWALVTCFYKGKPAIDRVTYRPGTRPPSFGMALWTVTVDHGALTLAQITKLLFAISGYTVPGMQNYHLLRRNCFWYTRVFRSLVTRILPDGAGQTNTYQDTRDHFWYILGSCCGFRVDGGTPNEPDVDNEEIDVLEARYNQNYNRLQQQLQQHQHNQIPVQVQDENEHQ